MTALLRPRVTLLFLLAVVGGGACQREPAPPAGAVPAAAPAGSNPPAGAPPLLVTLPLPPYPPVVIEFEDPSPSGVASAWERLFGVAVLSARTKKKGSFHHDDTTVTHDPDGKLTQYKDGSWQYDHNDGTKTWWDPKNQHLQQQSPDGSFQWCHASYGCGDSQKGFKSWEKMQDENLKDFLEKYHPPPGPTSPKSGGAGRGDPHYQTIDGVSITSQKLGEFVLTTGVPGRTIQARHEPFLDSQTVSGISAVAFDVNGHRVGVYLRPSPRLLIDGRTIAWSPFQQINLSGGGAVGLWTGARGARTVLIVWPDLSRTFVTSPIDGWLDVYPSWVGESAGRARGLLGTDNGSPADDLTGRDGARADPRDDAGVERFVESWRVTAGESLFAYGAGETTETFTNRSFPRFAPSLAAADRSKAEAICRGKGVAEGFAFNTCVYDVGLTGEQRFADSALEAGLALNRARLSAGSAAAAAKYGKGGTSPARPAAIAVTAGERAAAEAMPAGNNLKGTLEPGGSRLYRLTVPPNTSLRALTPLSCAGQSWDPVKTPGFAFFKADGTLVSGPHPVCADSPATAVDAGEYFLKVNAATQLTGSGAYELRYYPLEGPRTPQK